MRQVPETVSALAVPLRPTPPAWVLEPFAEEPEVDERQVGAPGRAVTSRRTSRWTLLSGSIAGASALKAPDLVDAVAGLYRTCADELAKQSRHAVRIWNFVPDIHGRLDGGDRYMAFNVGRYQAYCDWFGGPSRFPDTLPTASAVGVVDDALAIHVLAADVPGQPIENPRQTPSYQYSRRYGIRPPCFSRATRLGATLFIGGTASILGEHSHHRDDPACQTRETLRNIASLIRAASSEPTGDALGSLLMLRIHVPRSQDAAAVSATLQDLGPGLPAAEFVQADLCRRDLLVEIEGVASCQ